MEKEFLTLGDKIWLMEKNKPVEKIVVRILTEESLTIEHKKKRLFKIQKAKEIEYITSSRAKIYVSDPNNIIESKQDLLPADIIISDSKEGLMKKIFELL